MRTILKRLPHGALALPLVLALVALWVISTQPFVAPMASPPSLPMTVDPARLEADVRALTGGFARDSHRPEALGDVASHLAKQLAESGARVRRQPFQVLSPEGAPVTAENVVATFGPATPGPRVVIGAHYDVCGPHAGADDDTSGVAGVLALARLLGRTDGLARPVDLVLFALEEPPYFGTTSMGSARYVEELRGRGESVAAMLALEMIGYFDTREGSQRVPALAMRPFFPSRGDFVALVGRAEDAGLARTVTAAMRADAQVPVVPFTSPLAVPGTDYSDHRNFWSAGIPALMVTDTAFLRNANYHAAADGPETLDYARMADVVAGVYRATVVLARGSRQGDSQY